MLPATGQHHFFVAMIVRPLPAYLLHIAIRDTRPKSVIHYSCVCMYVASGAAGLVFMRVLAGGSIDAAKPVKEGLNEQQLADLLAATQAQEVRAQQVQRRRQGMGGKGQHFPQPGKDSSECWQGGVAT